MLTLDTKIEITNKNNTQNAQNIPIFCARIAKNNLTQAATSWHKLPQKFASANFAHSPPRTAPQATHPQHRVKHA